MKFIKIILFLALGMTLHGGKVTWNADGKPEIDYTSPIGKGCKLNNMLSLDNNATKRTIFLLDSNVSKTCT